MSAPATCGYIPGTDFDVIWLSPVCDALGDGQTWCSSPQEPCPECGRKWVRFVRDRRTGRRKSVKRAPEWYREIKAKMDSGLSFDEAWIACGGMIIPDEPGEAPK